MTYHERPTGWSLVSADGTDGERRTRMFAYMCPDTRRLAKRLAKQQKEFDEIELQFRYKKALTFKRAHEYTSLYGPHGVDNLHEADVSPDREPYFYLSVAYFIEQSFFDAVVAFNNSEAALKGHITWEHLRCFARAGSMEQRDKLFERCKRENWSYTTLRNKVDPWPQKTRKRKVPSSRKPSLATAAKNVVTGATKLCQMVASTTGTGLLQAVSKVARKNRTDAFINLVSARNAITASINELQATIGVFDEALSALNPGYEPPTAEAAGTGNETDVKAANQTSNAQNDD